MFHGRISLNLVLLLLLVNFVSGFRLELMYISLIEKIWSSLSHLHGFQLLVLLRNGSGMWRRLRFFLAIAHTITNSSGEFGLGETLSDSKVSIFLKT